MYNSISNFIIFRFRVSIVFIVCVNGLNKHLKRGYQSVEELEMNRLFRKYQFAMNVLKSGRVEVISFIRKTFKNYFRGDFISNGSL